MIKSTVKVLIIPDIHGRKFWKEDTDKYIEMIDNHLIDVVFLGDYVDPYPFEKISVRSSIKNFKEIIEFAKDRTNVHLLLGNHDMHYFDKKYASQFSYKCRYSYTYASTIRKIFKENKSMFKIAWDTKVNGKKFLFTHAGLLKAWAYIHMGKLHVRHGSIRPEYEIHSIEPTADSLNRLLESEIGILSLSDVSEDRGGYCMYGSPIWADCSEHINAQEYFPPGEKEIYWYDDIYQVFGHSLGFPWNDEKSLNICYISSKFAMLDARTSFILEDDGIIHDIMNIMKNNKFKDKEIYDKEDNNESESPKCD